MSTASAVHRITDEEALRELIGGTATETVRSKISDHVNAVTRRFIEASPYVCVTTGRPDGGLDVSPRGDPPGFVRVLDERTLFIPERPGNRIADTLTNLLHDDRIALLFLIPGIGDTFRVQGRAIITDDAELLAGSAVEGKVPRLGLLVTVDEAYTQCPKASLRSPCGTRHGTSTARRCRPAARCCARCATTASTPSATTASGPSATRAASGSTDAGGRAWGRRSAGCGRCAPPPALRRG
ncbi:MAG: MSMEG_1061 family FMN-dependent PPOX-type flavoprotein [Solirubrobacteraceae bacterium]